MPLGFVKRKIKSGNGYRAWVCRNDVFDITLDVIDGMFVEVVNDFPTLTRSDVSIEKSDRNNSMPNIIGIGFVIPEGVEIPVGYREYIPSYD